MRRSICMLLLFCAFASLPGEVACQGIKGRELLGIRLGGIISTGGVSDAFGNGTEMEIHFIEGLNPWLGIDVSLSSHNFGESRDRDKDIEYTGLDRPVDLYIFSLTAGPVAMKHVSKKLISTFEGGFGLYTINGVIQAGIFEGTRTNNQIGFYGGIGFLYRLTKSLSIDGMAKYHYVFSGDDLRHTIFFYTGEDRTSFIQIAVGVSIFTG